MKRNMQNISVRNLIGGIHIKAALDDIVKF